MNSQVGVDEPSLVPKRRLGRVSACERDREVLDEIAEHGGRGFAVELC